MSSIDEHFVENGDLLLSSMGDCLPGNTHSADRNLLFVLHVLPRSLPFTGTSTGGAEALVVLQRSATQRLAAKWRMPQALYSASHMRWSSQETATIRVQRQQVFAMIQ
eukprot:scpid106508/ scgid29413/ 